MTLSANLIRPVLAELVLGSPEWLIPTVVIGTVLTFLVLWNYSRSSALAMQTSWLSIVLKLAAIALLAVCLLEPKRQAQRPHPRANLLPILVDTSDSMQLKVGREQGSWRDRIDTDFAAESTTFASMAQSFETRFYGFDKRLTSAGQVSDLSRRGTGSRLIENLDELVDRLDDRPVAGVLLMTDGNVPGVGEDLDRLPKFPFPVYPVVPTQTSGMNDLRITGVSVRQTNFEISPVTLSVQFAVAGSMAGDVSARLVDIRTAVVVEEQTLSLTAGEDTYNASFQFRPVDVGLQFYRVDLFRQPDRDAFEQPETLLDQNSSETTLVNNTRLITVDRRSGPYRVLYVAGRPNWEFKFLRRAISEDAEVELTGLIRMANKEPKFSFRDKGVSETNPLFQGLGSDAEETAEQYDEPVMIRMGVKESEELESGFPKTAEELFPYDALIIDDIEPEFFSQDQLSIIRQFVSSRGAGLILLGGQEMFQGGDFADSILGDLSPVYVRNRLADQPHFGRLELTREGMLQPWMRLRKTASAESSRLKSMPEFNSINALGSLKPGAFQLATVRSGDTTLPAIAAQRFGKGKVGAIAVADLWRWALNRDSEHSDDWAQHWRQITRWLVGDVPRRTDISSKPSAKDLDAVNLTITAYDETFLPLDNPTVSISVIGPDEKTIIIDAKPIAESPGVFQATYFAGKPGPYIATAEVRSRDGELVGSPKTGWTQQIAGSEFDTVGINRPLLERIAKESGGALVKEANLNRFASRLNSSKVPVMETWEYPLWHRGWVIVLALGCLCAEWGLRRLRGLA